MSRLRWRWLLFRNRVHTAWLAYRHGVNACDGCGAASGLADPAFRDGGET